MRRHSDTFLLLTAFCVSTALLIWLLIRISHDGALSLGVNTDNRGRGPVFRASIILVFAAVSVSTGYVLVTILRDYLHDRRRKRIKKGRNA